MACASISVSTKAYLRELGLDTEYPFALKLTREDGQKVGLVVESLRREAVEWQGRRLSPE